MRKKLLSLLVLVMEAYGVLPSYGKMELKETLERGDWNVMLYGDDEKAHDWSIFSRFLVHKSIMITLRG